MNQSFNCELWDGFSNLWSDLEHLKERSALYRKPEEMLTEIHAIQEKINTIKERYLQSDVLKELEDEA